MINYKQGDQMNAVQEIGDLITVDPPIAVVNRLIVCFKNVRICKGKQKKTKPLVSRFLELCAEHMIRTGAVQSSRIGEVLAMQLLNNAALPDSTLLKQSHSLFLSLRLEKSQLRNAQYL